MAHALPIVTMAYGPCDNGPLITADMRGLCRIWDCTPRLRCSQQIEAAYLGVGTLQLASRVRLALDPMNYAVFAVAGEKRLLVWQQRQTVASGFRTDL
mmetsp:Transcript_30466/g.71622  ORF Transcript_30466/g.71622 Transcript_30466/m.71622 type:complete len:98 (-) Transcript_30466:15-308(-)